MINNNSLPRVQYPAMKNKQTEKKIASDQNEVNGDILGVDGGGAWLQSINQALIQELMHCWAFDPLFLIITTLRPTPVLGT